MSRPAYNGFKGRTVGTVLRWVRDEHPEVKVNEQWFTVRDEDQGYPRQVLRYIAVLRYYERATERQKDGYLKPLSRLVRTVVGSYEDTQREAIEAAYRYDRGEA